MQRVEEVQRIIPLGLQKKYIESTFKFKTAPDLRVRCKNRASEPDDIYSVMNII